MRQHLDTIRTAMAQYDTWRHSKQSDEALSEFLTQKAQTWDELRKVVDQCQHCLEELDRTLHSANIFSERWKHTHQTIQKLQTHSTSLKTKLKEFNQKDPQLLELLTDMPQVSTKPLFGARDQLDHMHRFCASCVEQAPSFNTADWITLRDMLSEYQKTLFRHPKFISTYQEQIGSMGELVDTYVEAFNQLSKKTQKQLRPPTTGSHFADMITMRASTDAWLETQGQPEQLRHWLVVTHAAGISHISEQEVKGMLSLEPFKKRGKNTSSTQKKLHQWLSSRFFDESFDNAWAKLTPAEQYSLTKVLNQLNLAVSSNRTHYKSVQKNIQRAYKNAAAKNLPDLAEEAAKAPRAVIGETPPKKTSSTKREGPSKKKLKQQAAQEAHKRREQKELQRWQQRLSKLKKEVAERRKEFEETQETVARLKEQMNEQHTHLKQLHQRMRELELQVKADNAGDAIALSTHKREIEELAHKANSRIEEVGNLRKKVEQLKQQISHPIELIQTADVPHKFKEVATEFQQVSQSFIEPQTTLLDSLNHLQQTYSSAVKLKRKMAQSKKAVLQIAQKKIQALLDQRVSRNLTNNGHTTTTTTPPTRTSPVIVPPAPEPAPAPLVRANTPPQAPAPLVRANTPPQAPQKKKKKKKRKIKPRPLDSKIPGGLYNLTVEGYFDLPRATQERLSVAFKRNDLEIDNFEDPFFKLYLSKVPTRKGSTGRLWAEGRRLHEGKAFFQRASQELYKYLKLTPDERTLLRKLEELGEMNFERARKGASNMYLHLQEFLDHGNRTYEEALEHYVTIALNPQKRPLEADRLILQALNDYSDEFTQKLKQRLEEWSE